MKALNIIIITISAIKGEDNEINEEKSKIENPFLRASIKLTIKSEPSLKTLTIARTATKERIFSNRFSCFSSFWFWAAFISFSIEWHISINSEIVSSYPIDVRNFP